MQNEEIIIGNKVSSVIPTAKKRIMVAGIGNLFLQDDGFGPAVIKRIRESDVFENIEVNDMGIGGLKLAYDLMKGYDGLILIDSSPRGETPGTLYVIEPEEKEISSDLTDGSFIDPHGGDPATVFRFIKALNAWPGKVVIIGCEPRKTDDFEIGLSEPVAASIEQAVELVKKTIDKMNQA